MPDMALLQGAITGLKTAADIAQGLVGLKVGTEVNAKAIELQQAILSAQSSALAAQSEQFTMLQRIRDLEGEVTRVRAWKEIEQRYELKEITPGFLAYAMKQEGSRPEPFHWICPSCYQHQKKSLLQKRGNEYGGNWECHECKFRATFEGKNLNV